MEGVTYDLACQQVRCEFLQVLRAQCIVHGPEQSPNTDLTRTEQTLNTCSRNSRDRLLGLKNTPSCKRGLSDKKWADPAGRFRWWLGSMP